MKKLLLIIGVVILGLKASGQGFPNTDSLRTYNIKYITNNPATAFTNLRLHTLLRGIIDHIDTARSGGGSAIGIDTLWALNDSTIRYRKNGAFKNVVLKGVYDTRRKVDTAFAVNDTTLRITINGSVRNIIIPGRGGVVYTNATGGGDTLLTASNTIKRIDRDNYGIVISTNANKLLFSIDTTQTNHLVTTSDLNDAIAASPGGITELTGPITAGPGSGSQVTSITDNSIQKIKLEQSPGLSVIGNIGNTTDDVGNITAANDGNVLRRFGTSLGFGAINLASTNAVGSSILPVLNGGTGTGTPSLIAGTNITSITGTWPNQTINAAGGSGEANTASNQGSGVGIFKTKSGVDLQFKSHTSDTNLIYTGNTNDVNIKIAPNTLNYINYLNKPVPFNKYSIFLGNSITYGYNAEAGGTLKAYPAYIKDYLNLDNISNLAISGGGTRRLYRQYAENLNPITIAPVSTMYGFNNVRGTTDTAHVFELVRAGHRATAALQFIKHDQIQFYITGTAGTANSNFSLSQSCGSCTAASEDSLREYGSRAYWYRHNDADNTSMNWWKKSSITANETVTISNVGGAGIAIGTWAATSVWSRIEVRVDGVLKTTYDPNGRIGTYWADGFGTNGICNDAIIILGLRDTLHTVQLKFLDGGAMGGFDYIAPLKSQTACLPIPLYVWDLIHMNATGYAIPGGVVTEAQLDSTTTSRWRDLQYYFPGYPIYQVHTNTYYDPNDPLQIQSDGAHPKSLGEEKVAMAAIDVMGPKWLSGASGGLNLDDVLTNGNTSSKRLLLTGANGSNSNMEVGSDIALQVAAPSVSWMGSNMKFNGSNNVYIHNGTATQWYLNNGGYMHFLNASSGSAGATATMNLRLNITPSGDIDLGGTISDATTGAGAAMRVNANSHTVWPNIASIGPVASLGSTFRPVMIWAAGSQPGIALYNSMGGTNQKMWDFTTTGDILYGRMSPDDYSTAGNWMTVTRTGYASAVVDFPTGSVTVADDAYDATTWNTNPGVPTKNAIRDKIESLPIGNGIYGGNGSLPSDVTVTGGANGLTFNNVFNYRINANAFILDEASAGHPYTGAVLGSGKQLWLGYTPTPATYDKGPGIVIDTNNNVGLGGPPTTTMPLYATGNSTYLLGLQSAKGNYYRVNAITSNATVNIEQYFFTVDATGGNITITLPAASTAFGDNMGIQYVFQRLDNSGNTVTITRAGSDTVNGTTTTTITTQYAPKTLQCISTSAWAAY